MYSLGYRDLLVWQRAVDLVVTIYKMTETFPRSEQFGLTSQMRRSALSIPSNIAEGYRRNSKKEYARFVSIAFGSGAELETQLLVAKRLGYSDEIIYSAIDDSLSQIMKMLNTLHRRLR